MADTQRQEQVSTAMLRVGLLVESVTVRNFEAAIVQAVVSDPNAQLLAIVVQSPSQPAKTHRYGLFDFYERRDVKRRNDPASDPLAMVDDRDLLSQYPTIAFGPDKHRDAVAQLRALDLDVIVRFGLSPAHGDLVNAARFGVWSVTDGDGQSHPSLAPFFWEAHDDCDVSAVTVIAEHRDATWALATSYVATRAASLAWNRRQPYWEATLLMVQRLYALQEQGWETVRARAQLVESKTRARPRPNNAQMARWLCANTLRKLKERREPPSVKHWRVAIRIGSPLDATTDGPPDMRGFQFHESPVGHFYADPFLWEREGERWLFFEDYSYVTRRGTLACAQVFADATLGAAQSVLDLPYHLSYPCLFEDEGELYMIPETGDNGTIELYRCTNFPTGWVLDHVLVELRAFDATITQYNGRYWMLVTVPEPHAESLQLMLFSSDTLRGDWKPHPCNPISSDIRSCRSGGAFLHDGERLIRVSQDGSRVYGRSFAFHEITTLTADDYGERPLTRVEPTWADGLIGTHTYSRDGDVEAVDGLVRRPRQGTAV